MSNDVSKSDAPGETIVVDETRLGRFQVVVKSGTSTFLMDEPVAAGGMGSGPNPYDLLSAALGSCTLMTVRLYADFKKLPLTRVRVTVTHQRSRLNARDVFARKIFLDGNLDDVQRAKLLDIANHCPVHMTLNRGADVETALVKAPLDEPATEKCEHMTTMEETCGVER